MHDELLKAIRERMGRQTTEHNRGILTADRYAKTLLECVGSDLCYRYAATKDRSFDDALKRAAKTLTYNNQDMVLEEVVKGRPEIGGTAIELPKNTLLVFKHTLTTPRKDRDGDILRTQGAKPDPKMLLLWQHVHTLPIGKVLGIAEHTSKRLSLYTAIVDVNALAHDAAVMIENKMGRFSHGFRAIDFTESKAEPGGTTGGFDVKEFEILEASLVSVPSNIDADTEDVILSLVDGGKLTSPIMKSVGTSIREGQNATTVTVATDLGDLGDGTKTDDNGCQCNGKPKRKPGTPEEADDDNDENKNGKEGAAAAQDDKGLGDEIYCPVCAVAATKSGYCPHCGDDIRVGTKAGRVLSKANYEKLNDAAEDMKELSGHCSTRTGKAMCSHARTKVLEVVKTAGHMGESATEEFEQKITVKQAAATILADADPEERKNLLAVLQSMATVDLQTKRTGDYRGMHTLSLIHI